MTIILAIISIIIAAIGLLTYRDSADRAYMEHNYEPLGMSAIMVIVGVFCTGFFLVDLSAAAMCAILSAIVLILAYFANAYVSRRTYSFINGKIQRNGGNDLKSDDAKDIVENMGTEILETAE